MAERVQILQTRVRSVYPAADAPPTLPVEVVQLLDTETRIVDPVTDGGPGPGAEVVQLLDTTIRMVSPMLLPPDEEPPGEEAPGGVEWWVWAIIGGVFLIIIVALIASRGK